MANPFTDHSRDARLSVNLPGFIEKLRAPEVLHAVIMRTKPDHVSLPDHVLVTLLNDVIDTLQSRRDFRGIQSLLGTVFGEGSAMRVREQQDHDHEVPHGTTGDDQHHGRGQAVQMHLGTAMVAVGKRGR